MDASERARKRQKREGEVGAGAQSPGDLMVPAKPERFLSASKTVKEFDDGMNDLLEAFVKEEDLRDAFKKPFKELRKQVEHYLRMVHSGEGDDNSFEKFQSSMREFLGKLKDCPENIRGYNSSTISAYISAGLFHHFLAHGKVASRTEFAEFTANEFLFGLMQFADEVETYGIGRAMWQDSRSVGICCRMEQAILEALLKFNFRNGPLRRKFDVIKYKVKKMENVLYELSLVREENQGNGEENDPSTVTLNLSNIIDMDEYEKLAKEIDDATEAREQVIKQTRDIQKDSKKAIYSLHRSQFEEARKLLTNCKTLAEKIRSETSLTTNELNHGAFGSALEEYAEGRILEEWLCNDGALLPFPTLASEIGISEKDYLGGLIDFTGELGRYGVLQATNRNIDAVKSVLASMLAIKEYAIQLQESMSGKLNKKLDAVITNTRKMENTLYELTLLMCSRRKTMELSSTSTDMDQSES